MLQIWLVSLHGLVLTLGPPQPGTAPKAPSSATARLSEEAYLRRHAETRGFMLGRPVGAVPVAGGEAVLFLRSQARIPTMSLYEFDARTKQVRELLTPEQILRGSEEQLSPQEKARRERMRVSTRGFTEFQLSDDGSQVIVGLSGRTFLLSRQAGTVRELSLGQGTVLDPRFSPDGRHVAYVKDHDLWVLDLAGGKPRQLTFGGTALVSHGLAEFVAQEEMDRFAGYWWSPDSQWIAYEEADARGVDSWYVADPARPAQPPHPTPYPRPGKANVKVRLAVISAKSDVGGTARAEASVNRTGSGGSNRQDTTVWVNWDRERYPYLVTVKWHRGGPLSLIVQTRDQKEMVLLEADHTTGNTIPLLVERDPAWLNLDQDVPRWLEDGTGFLWTSERAGGRQLELRDRAGRLKRALVEPSAGYNDLVDVDEKSRLVTYRGGPNPTGAQLFRVPLDGGEPTQLTDAPGLYSTKFAKDHSLYVQTSASLNVMPRATVHRRDGSLVGELPSVAEEPPFTPRAEIVKVGTNPQFYASIVRPQSFAAGRRYPVIVDVYAGPHFNHVTATMRSRLLAQWLADQGFIVVSIDGRGTPRRGRDWERAIEKSFATLPLDDQVTGLRALGRRYPEMDLDRVGIVGWSFGGYVAALAVLKRPDVFKAAVAGAPVVDWQDYDTHYTERYLGLPQENPSVYRDSSLLTYAAGLRRPLLLVHGTSDDNVFFLHSLKLSDALFRAGREHEFLVLSGLTHMVPDPVITERLWSRIAGHFQKHLGGPTP